MSTLRPSSTSTTSTWIRWMPLWHGLFYMSLVLSTGIALVEGLHTWQQTGELLGLSLVFGLWCIVSVVISPLSWQARPLLTIAYLAGGWLLWFGLTELDPVYLFVLFGLYPQVFVLAPLPGKILGALLLTALCAWQQVTLAGGIGGNLFLTLAAGVSGILMALFIYTIVEQSQQQQRLIGELETTRQALATAERQAGVQALATTTGRVHALRPEIEVTLLRAAQEALANAHKHASASQVVLTLSYMDGMVVLDVQDNGVGFDTTRLSLSPVEQPAGGFGLKALRERVGQLGGMLSIESSCGEGTTIAVALPAAGNEPPSPQEARKEIN